MAVLNCTWIYIICTMDLLDSSWLYSTMHLQHSTWLYVTLYVILLESTSFYHCCTSLYLTLHDTTMALLDSTFLYFTLPWLYFILFTVPWLYNNLLDSTSLYCRRTLLHSTWQYFTMPLLHSTSLYITLPWLYFTQLDCSSYFPLLESTLFYHGSIYLILLGSVLICHSSTSPYLTLLYYAFPSLYFHHSTEALAISLNLTLLLFNIALLPCGWFCVILFCLYLTLLWLQITLFRPMMD